MDSTKLRSEPIKSKMKLTGFYRYYDGSTLVGKECINCGIFYPIANYHKAKDKKDGTVSKCRGCVASKVASKYEYKYDKSGSQIPGWLDEIAKNTELAGLKVNLARRYRGWQGARFYDDDGAIAGKVCPACKKAIIVDLFSRNTGHPDGLSTYCKKCSGALTKEYSRLRYTDDPDYYKSRSIKSYEKYFSRTDEEIRNKRESLYPEGTKKCRVCRNILELSKYDAARGRTDGLAQDCKNCKVTRRKRVCTEYWNISGIPLICYLSSCTTKFEEIDHVVPVSLDGLDELSNLLPICSHHNKKKHGSLLPLWLMENHPDDYQKTMDTVERYGVDVWGSYVPEM